MRTTTERRAERRINRTLVGTGVRVELQHIYAGEAVVHFKAPSHKAHMRLKNGVLNRTLKLVDRWLNASGIIHGRCGHELKAPTGALELWYRLTVTVRPVQ